MPGQLGRSFRASCLTMSRPLPTCISPWATYAAFFVTSDSGSVAAILGCRSPDLLAQVRMRGWACLSRCSGATGATSLTYVPTPSPLLVQILYYFIQAVQWLPYCIFRDIPTGAFASLVMASHVRLDWLISIRCSMAWHRSILRSLLLYFVVMGVYTYIMVYRMCAFLMLCNASRPSGSSTLVLSPSSRASSSVQCFQALVPD